ncbi:SsrA-binding protein SmpB [Rickettsiales endosymbiont of Stachyamoeba lipophora]|uniref:SsrA-binding protein SmpB n=1 Tax=Rickettsiales endosymbiont of Stachyamoeba lipophora TaxID=2486578 RepID=UPI000F64AF05|nr:SsrA-binding protein SmpB [Rickettsiales endosymbiont of Stachyamoeba lipophora]AZL15586.1 SsrA-binding protein SmpB [Rickettsiales endosymbiont of Stachyamoeba lipophora]
MSSKKNPNKIIVASNRKARFDYFIEESFEVGIVLIGSEVKSLREGKANINEAYAIEQNNEIYLMQAHISEYKGANQFNHEPKRARKLLLHRKQINKLIGKVKIKGYSLIPLEIYFNGKRMAKVTLALAKGKQNIDKRETIKEREWKREQSRLVRSK